MGDESRPATGEQPGTERPVGLRGDMSPGDEVPPGAPSAGENICRECGGEGRLTDGGECATCGGTGRVVESVSGGE